MQVDTFYSYKGGVGRTLACANFGLYLAKTGKKVVLADMDFEAPGLDSKFASVDVSQVQAGMMDQFWAFQHRRELPELQANEIALPEDVASSGGRLHLIPAGNYLSGDYFKRFSSIKWDNILGTEEGLAFCFDLLKRIEEKFEADILIIDSRTGLTEIGGLCTQVLPDSVILLTSMSAESLRGTRRVYERIAEGPITKRRQETGMDPIELRVVIARTTRPDDLEKAETTIKERLGLPVERLFYLFDQRDLAFDEYLAIDRFDSHPEILDDYMELFNSFHPEITEPYVAARLDSFRLDLFVRPAPENERIIQELLTLFPIPLVTLEAARFYRISKEYSRSLENYIRYLNAKKKDSKVLAEFVDVFSDAPERVTRSRQEIFKHLKRFGPERMSAKVLSRYVRYLDNETDRSKVVNTIESDDEKFADSDFREIYFNVLHASRQWDYIISQTSPLDRSNPDIALTLAEALIRTECVEDALDIMSREDPSENPNKWVTLLYSIYETAPDMIGYLLQMPGFPKRYLRHMYIHADSEQDERFDERFKLWLKNASRRETE